MRKYTEKIKIPSIKFSPELIKELKPLLEGEYQERLAGIKYHLKKEKDFFNRTLIESQLDCYYVQYTLTYKDEITNATSIEELFELTSPRIEFDSFTARIDALRDNEFVEIYMRISLDYIETSYIEMSSDNVDSLIVRKDKFKKLFKKHLTSYSGFYNIPWQYRTFIDIFVVFTSTISLSVWLAKLKIFTFGEKDVSSLFLIAVGLTLNVFYVQVFRKYLIPFIWFDKPRKTGILALFASIGTGLAYIFWDVISTLIKRFLGSRRAEGL